MEQHVEFPKYIGVKKQLIKILNVKLIKFSQINYHEFEEKCNPTSKIELSILKLLKIQKDT